MGVFLASLQRAIDMGVDFIEMDVVSDLRFEPTFTALAFFHARRSLGC